jgi:hypothetical protein
MKNKHCSGSRLLQPFLLLIFSVVLGFILLPAYAELQHVLSWDPLPAYLRYTKIFYANQLTTIGWGSFNFVSNALTPGVCHGDHYVDDTLTAVADIYVIPAGTIKNRTIRFNLADQDISGSFNTVVQESGFFVNETIGSPGGKLTEGYYAVIYDECQDGYFDDGIDFLMDPAFKVVAQVSPLPDDINGVKLSAKQQADTYGRVAALTGALWFVSTLSSVSGDAFDFALWFYEAVLPSLFPHSFSDPFFEVTKLLVANTAHVLAIAADPPDADFKQLMPLSGRHIIALQSSDPLLIAMANVGTASSTQGALAEALLHSLARYQGAEAAGAGPAILCPADIHNTVGQTVTLGTPRVTDSVDPNPVVSNNAPASFPAGTTTVMWTATDDTGNSASCQQQVTLTSSYAFTGFFPPVDNPPVLNQVKAGQAIPLKFRLGGNQGLNIFASGFPVSQGIVCSSTAVVDDIEHTVTAGSSSLSYDAVTDQYTYVWKTNTMWSGTCRQLIMRLNDSEDYRANFKFK